MLKTSRANILNLKLETVNGFLQKIKIARDKLLAVCIVLRGLPKEFALGWINLKPRP